MKGLPPLKTLLAQVLFLDLAHGRLRKTIATKGWLTSGWSNPDTSCPQGHTERRLGGRGKVLPNVSLWPHPIILEYQERPKGEAGFGPSAPVLQEVQVFWAQQTAPLPVCLSTAYFPLIFSVGLCLKPWRWLMDCLLQKRGNGGGELPGTARTTQHSVAEAETVRYFTAHSGAHGR